MTLHESCHCALMHHIQHLQKFGHPTIGHQIYSLLCCHNQHNFETRPGGIVSALFPPKAD